MTFSLLIFTSMAALSLSELEAAIFALQSNGFNLFGNSIAVSELSVQLLSHKFHSTSIKGHGFTFLAPPNSALFSLDMSTDAFTYTHSLRFHVIPRRLSLSQLHNISLSSNPHLQTLVPGHFLFVTSYGRRFVAVDGVRIFFPDLYLRSEIAVHGLDGLLVTSTEEYFHRLDSFHANLSPTPTISAVTSGEISASDPAIEAQSPHFVSYPSLSPEINQISSPTEASTPEFEGFKALSPEFDGISEIRSPVGTYSQNFDSIPTSHDIAFTGGTYNVISIPPIDAYSPENDGIIAPSPPPTFEFLSPDEYSISPTVDELFDAELFSPNALSTVWDVPSPSFSIGEWQDKSEHKYGEDNAKLEDRKSQAQDQSQGQSDENGWRDWEF